MCVYIYNPKPAVSDGMNLRTSSSCIELPCRESVVDEGKLLLLYIINSTATGITVLVITVISIVATVPKPQA